MKTIDILDLFSGIGGFAKGFQDAGFTVKNHWFSEIDKHAIANYKYNFKHAEYVGSVENVRGSSIRPQVITFGSPCQGFSLAGSGNGLGDKRSNLILEAIRIIGKFRPNVFIWENVKGAFSTNAGADFWAVIKAFADIGGYRLEWQLLNTSWFLPQNRERIYLIGHLAERSRPGIFPFREIDKMFNEGRRQISGQIQTQNDIANCLTKSMHKSGRTDTYIKQINQLNDFNGKSTKQQNRVYDESGLSPTLNTDNRKNIQLHTGIRRLTEIECERLQGFPDDWTKWGNYDGKIKEIAKTNRYQMLGNAVTVNVVKAIAERIELM